MPMQPHKHTKKLFGHFGIKSWILVTMLTQSLTATADSLRPNTAYLMYDRNGPTYEYTSSTESLGVPTNSMNSLVTSSRQGMPSAQLINMPSGSYIIVPNTTTGRVMSVIHSSRGK